jgi:integrase
VGLAGEWYNWFVARYENDPGRPERWETEWWRLIDALLDHAPAEVREEPIRDLEWTRDPEIRAGIRPVLADRGHTAQFLADRGLSLTNEAQTLFLDCVLDNYSAALLLLERRAKGDYEPDELPKSFPAFFTSGPLTPWELFEGWVKSKQPAQSTVESWRTVFNTLTRDFPDRSASAITPDEAQQWLDKLITEERSAFTVRNTWLRATRTVFAWGARRKLTSNPFEAAVVDVPRRKQLRPKWLYEHERVTILKAAAAVIEIDNPDDAARRWVPWLLAYSGARPQDITQLRGKDVQAVDGIWTLNVTPEAGTVKNAQARRVPLHDHLIEQGFLDFVKSKGDGPLFYRPRRAQGDNSEPTKHGSRETAKRACGVGRVPTRLLGVPTRLLSVALSLASREAVRPGVARLRMRPAALLTKLADLRHRLRWETSLSGAWSSRAPQDRVSRTNIRNSWRGSSRDHSRHRGRQNHQSLYQSDGPRNDRDRNRGGPSRTRGQRTCRGLSRSRG